ncbi:copper resistance CopC family protein [Caulobacter sp. 17J65-9]|uniref:copper resistance CopC family protein n=1 Tax=Caulobacter sp. 17J65-9 TaxID=2709382 RepID=UPI0013CD654C|nr:copper resistance CopC family protein [Caulobacter sp. 17J65-9]NEX91559.1 copper resistance protein CopC [Caulobacter sp. 17J65-9]
MKLVLAAALALAVATPALADHAGMDHGAQDHADHGAMMEGGLKSSSPESGSTVSAPKTLVLTFEHPMKLDMVTLTGPNGATLKLKGGAAVADSATVKLPVLAAGVWKAAWHATSADGHMMYGALGFTVR